MRLNRRREIKSAAQLDWSILIVVVGLVAFGVLMVFEASIVEAFHELGDQWYFIRNQSKYALMGLLLGIVAYVFPLKKLERLALPLIFSAIFLLIVVLIPGIGTKVQGARRWLDMGPVRIQPSEYAKLAGIIYFAAWFSKERPARSFLALTGLLLGLIILEPDMGTALVLVGIAVSMYFISGVAIAKLLKILGLEAVGTILLIAMAPYRLDRVKTFFDVSHDPLGVSYHARQVLISLGSGGLMGTGLGRSRQKFQYLPEASTDSIFAVVGEEFGFIGALILISAYGWVIFRGLGQAKRIKDPFAANIAAGVSVWMAVQVLLNLFAMVGLVPLTGIPLPLISYGGSNLMVMSGGIGLLLNASRQDHIC